MNIITLMTSPQFRSISRLISSGAIVDFGKTYGGIGGRIEDWLQTRRSLKIIQSLFPGYSFKLFREECLLNYQELKKANEEGDHVLMMRYLSPDLYNLWKSQKTALLFYPQILDFKLKRSRIHHDEYGLWAQMTITMAHPVVKGSNYTSQIKYCEYVLEKKYETVTPSDFWRFRHFPT